MHEEYIVCMAETAVELNDRETMTQVIENLNKISQNGLIKMICYSLDKENYEFAEMMMQRIFETYDKEVFKEIIENCFIYATLKNCDDYERFFKKYSNIDWINDELVQKLIGSTLYMGESILKFIILCGWKIDAYKYPDVFETLISEGKSNKILKFLTYYDLNDARIKNSVSRGIERRAHDALYQWLYVSARKHNYLVMLEYLVHQNFDFSEVVFNNLSKRYAIQEKIRIKFYECLVKARPTKWMHTQLYG